MSKATPAVCAPRASAVHTLLRLAVCAAPLVLAAGCAAFPSLTTEGSRPPLSAQAEAATDTASDPSGAAAQDSARLTTFGIPGRSSTGDDRPVPATEQQIAALVGDEVVDAALAPQSIPQFVSTVFGGVLGVPFVMSPDVASRSEIISGGTGGSISSRDLFRLTQLALKQYGVEIYINGGLVTVGAPGAVAAALCAGESWST